MDSAVNVVSTVSVVSVVSVVDVVSMESMESMVRMVSVVSVHGEWVRALRVWHITKQIDVIKVLTHLEKLKLDSTVSAYAHER